MIARIAITLALFSAFAFAQAASTTVSGTTAPSAGQTATASLNLTPAPLWTLTFNCTQTKFVLASAGMTGAQWTCTATSNLVAPVGGSFVVTFAPSTAVTVNPSPLTIPASASSANFTVTGN